jgi:hypothetical protein
MEYIIYKDFVAKAICGEVNLPKGTTCTEKSGILYHEENPLCFNNSENAFLHFARNHDGRGAKRGELIATIKDTLATVDEHHFERWHRVWTSPICKQFNRGGDFWNWNYAFYNAEVYILEYIKKLITDENWLGLTAENTEIPDEISDSEALAILRGEAE